MIVIGQYVRAVLANGIAAALPSIDGFEAQLDREGVVVEIRKDDGILVLEDFFGTEHDCHLNGAVVVDPRTLDPFLHNWAVLRSADMGISLASVSP